MSARSRLRALLILVAIGASLFAFARPAAASSDEDYYINKINQIRASRGLGTLVVNGQLTAVARSWSQHMAGDGTLEHNPNLAGQVSGWRMLGENVGTGPSDDSIEAAFESSPHHFENMVDPSFTEIGVGVVQDSSGTYWVTEDFEQPKNAGSPAPAPSHSTPAPPRSAARPAPKPAPAPRPAPTPVHAAVHPASAPAAASPVTVATTVAPTPLPTVPLAVLGSSAKRPAPASGLSVASPFTETNVLGLLALAVLGTSMAMFSRVRVRTASLSS